jgi:hypothetical protein
VSSLQATSFRLVSLHIAPAVRIFNHIENIRPAVPENCCNDQPRDMVFQELLQVSATQREVCEIQKRRREQQGPKPAEFDKVNVEEIVGAREIRFWKRYKVCKEKVT